MVLQIDQIMWSPKPDSPSQEDLQLQLSLESQVKKQQTYFISSYLSKKNITVSFGFFVQKKT